LPGFAETMHEWGQGGLHSGSKKGPIVSHPGGQKQALAIAFSQARKAGESVKGAAQRKAFSGGK
jgi:hypothetical protein